MDRLQQTICALATPPGTGGIAVVRVSGPDAYPMVEKIFVPLHVGRKVAEAKGYTAMLGHYLLHGQEMDETIALFFRAPHSYTGEDVIELSVHGGTAMADGLLEALITAGTAPAGPGEFTRRALEHGRMSLTQAEAVMEVIAANGRQGAALAKSALDGRLAKRIGAIQTVLQSLNAHLTAWIDYPEEDVEEVSAPVLLAQLGSVEKTLSRLEQSWQQGQMVRQGISTAIIGSANVGKSTLMNLLSGRERSIVTAIAGTTRDVIEETVCLGELTLRLSDTAGLRESDDPIEQIGVERSRRALKQCDLILAVFDESRPLTAEERQWLPALAGRAAVAVYNKQDLPPVLTAEEKAEIAAVVPASVAVSAAAGTGLHELTEAIRKVVGLSHFDPAAAVIANARQLECITAARRSLREGMEALQAGETLDAVSVCLEQSADALLTLTGRRASAEAIDKVFEQFCVGK